MMMRPMPSEARRRGAALLAVAAIAGALVPSYPAWAQPETDRRVFDIRAQPLAAALARFATESGVDIAYRQSLANDRRSSPVQGEYPAAVALRMLLRDTGLSARFTGPRAAIIFETGPTEAAAPRPEATIGATPALRLEMAEVRAPIMVGMRDRSSHRRYAMAVQGEIRDLLRSDASDRRQSLRLEIRITVDRHGVIHDVAIRRPSGDDVWDRQVLATLTNHSLSQPPPADLSEPLMFEVASDRVADHARRQVEDRP